MNLLVRLLQTTVSMFLAHFIFIILLLPTLITSLNEGYGDHYLPFSFGQAETNVTIQVGSSAYLHCPVVNLGEREVSWWRHKDWHILTHGTVTFTSDDRFQVIKQNDDWVLMIKFVVARDSGIYECQVNTEEGIKSRKVELKVVTPEAFILADEEYHIERGSSLSLVCIIEKATAPPQYVFWYHNERMINYDSERGISVSTSPGRKTHSQLSIKTAEISDSGNYTCKPSSSLPASIQVFVSGSEVKPWVSDEGTKSLTDLPLLFISLLVSFLNAPLLTVGTL
ncbi:transmembrane and immunoglobulin domain-containing protein 1 [Lepeophtheirus salmonis]|nr:zwei Ig domain protein zig-8-like [Lepeophtheirus salmonis]